MKSLTMSNLKTDKITVSVNISPRRAKTLGQTYAIEKFKTVISIIVNRAN